MCQTASDAIFGSGPMTKMGSARSTHSHRSHRSGKASLNVSNKVVAGMEAKRGPSGPIKGSGSSRLAEDCRVRERMVIVAAAFLNPPPVVELVEEEEREESMGADSALGEFWGCCPNGIAAVTMLPSKGKVRMVPGCGAGQAMISLANAWNIDIPCSK